MAKRGYLAVDIGGTKLSVGVVSGSGEILSHGRALTPQTQVWSTLSELIASQMAASEVELVACGVGCGGPMSPNGDFVSTLHIPEWRDFPLRSSLEKLVQMPVYIDGDAKALVQGEVWCVASAAQPARCALAARGVPDRSVGAVAARAASVEHTQVLGLLARHGMAGCLRRLAAGRCAVTA